MFIGEKSSETALLSRRATSRASHWSRHLILPGALRCEPRPGHASRHEVISLSTSRVAAPREVAQDCTWLRSDLGWRWAVVTGNRGVASLAKALQYAFVIGTIALGNMYVAKVQTAGLIRQLPGQELKGIPGGQNLPTEPS